MQDDDLISKTQKEVEEFLNEAHELTKSEDTSTINMQPWNPPKINKTLEYMMGKNIKANMVRETVQELELENYSATKPERNPHYSGEIWEFGITKNMVDEDEDLYVKLKIEGEVDERFLTIMSFHPEEPPSEDKKLKFPYKN